MMRAVRRCKRNHVVDPYDVGMRGACRVCVNIGKVARRRGESIDEFCLWLDHRGRYGAPVWPRDSRLCRNGHLRTVESTYLGQGYRRCRVCACLSQKARRQLC